MYVAKNCAQWFLCASNWLTNSKTPALPHSSSCIKNPSFTTKRCYVPVTVQCVCHLHVDGAWKGGLSWSGIDFTASHPNEIFIAKHALSTNSSTPIQTEIQACYEAINWALSHNYNMV